MGVFFLGLLTDNQTVRSNRASFKSFLQAVPPYGLQRMDLVTNHRQLVTEEIWSIRLLECRSRNDCDYLDAALKPPIEPSRERFRRGSPCLKHTDKPDNDE
jgi:hypothetical protein